eukprot:scaffold676769_cov57-Prasinocladus_malaysianus.AAC.1
MSQMKAMSLRGTFARAGDEENASLVESNTHIIIAAVENRAKEVRSDAWDNDLSDYQNGAWHKRRSELFVRLRSQIG